MLEKLPFYGQVLVFAGLSIGIVLAAYFIYPDLGAMRVDIVELQDELADKQREINKGRAIEQRLPFVRLAHGAEPIRTPGRRPVLRHRRIP